MCVWRRCKKLLEAVMLCKLKCHIRHDIRTLSSYTSEHTAFSQPVRAHHTGGRHQTRHKHRRRSSPELDRVTCISGDDGYVFFCLWRGNENNETQKRTALHDGVWSLILFLACYLLHGTRQGVRCKSCRNKHVDCL